MTDIIIIITITNLLMRIYTRIRTIRKKYVLMALKRSDIYLHEKNLPLATFAALFYHKIRLNASIHAFF